MKERFGEIYREYESAIYGYLFYMTQEEQTAQDLSQETFLKIYLGYKKLREESHLKAWCMTIARNTFLSYARKKKPFLLGDEAIYSQIPASEPSPEAIILQSERRREIQELLLKLNESDRTVLILRDYEGLSYADIAGVMGLTEPVVKVRIYRARTRLKKLYEAEAGRMGEVDL